MKLITLIFLLLSFNLSIAQQSTKYFSAGCTPNWKKGEKKVLLITRTNKEYSGGKLLSNSVIPLNTNITVIDSSAEGYTSEWVFHLTDKFKKENLTYKEQMPGYDGLKMIFKIRNDGSF